MSTGDIVAVAGAGLGALALALGAVLTWRSARRTTDHTRIRSLETRVDKLETRYNVLWRYARDLVDHIYRRKEPPPPPWPDELLEE